MCVFVCVRCCGGHNGRFVPLAAAIMAVLFAMRNDTWVGNPSGPSGHLPYEAEEFCLRTDKLFVAWGYKSHAAVGTVHCGSD